MVVRICAKLTPGCIASSVHETQPLRIWENSSIFAFKIKLLLRNQRTPMNCSVNFFVKFSMSYEYCQSFRDVPNMRILADNAINNNVVQFSFVDLDELFRKISSDSIVPVASTREFPQYLMSLRVIDCSTLAELTISTSWGRSWSRQDSSTCRFGPLDVNPKKDPFLDVDGTLISVTYWWRQHVTLLS